MIDADLTEDLDDLDEPGADFTDADAFFAAEVRPVRPAVLHMYGRDYELPRDVPLAFTLLSERHREESGLEVFQEILAPLFGADTLDFWISKGCGARRMGIVLGWTIANLNQPGSVSLAEAAARYDEATSTSGKAPTPTTSAGPNRTSRRRQKRGGSGRRSSRAGH